MWLVRPAQPDDVDGILELAEDYCSQLSSTVPKTREGLSERIELSSRSFSGELAPEQCQRFLFVLVDSRDGQVQGVAGIDGRAGNGQPFYNYRMDALIHSSHELGISRRVDVLYPSHALTGHTLLGAFMIAPGLCDSDAFELLSRARLVFIATHRDWFADGIAVEIQGLQSESGEVPFWDSLGRHFFDMDFDTADRYSGMLSKTFIAELMPPNPIYVTLLSEPAQQALGQAHPATRRSVALLQREGFQRGSYVDIFDGGPVLEARTSHLKTLVTSLRKSVSSTESEDGEQCLLAHGDGPDFRCTLAGISESLRDIVLAPLAVLHGLGCDSGDEVMVAPL